MKGSNNGHSFDIDYKYSIHSTCSSSIILIPYTLLLLPLVNYTEPTDEWTIEELLHWCLLHSQHKTVLKRDEIMNAYQELFNNGKQEIMNLQDEMSTRSIQQQNQQSEENENGVDEKDIVQNGQHQSNNDIDLVMKGIPTNDENQHPNNNNRNGIRSTKKTKSNSTKISTIQIEIIAGPHQSEEKYMLKPQQRKPCWIGRSTSKKFRDRGISLSKDAEVSTTHGKFHIYPSGVDGKLVFTDTGSTNGTMYGDQELEDNVPLELVDGMVLVFGSSHLLIHLV